MKTLRMLGPVLLMVLTLLAGCGGGGGSSTSNGLTITGKVLEPSGGTWVPSANATVTLRSANNESLYTTNSADDGTYTIQNVPASTDIYINVRKNGYASFNTRILNSTQSMRGDLPIMSAPATKAMVDAIYGSAGGASWSDPFYGNKSWFGIEIRDSSGKEIPNISVASDPVGPVVKYNDGMDGFATATATISSRYTPLIGGYNSTSGTYTLTFDRFSQQTTKLPMVAGEITLCSYIGTYTGHSWSAKSLNMDLNAIAWSGTQYVGVGNDGFVGTSPDGATWTRRTSGTTKTLYDIVWTGSKYVAVGTTVLVSSDGINWHAAQSPVDSLILKCVVWTGTQFVAGGYYGEIVTSTDGETWVSRWKTDDDIEKIIWTGTKFVAMGGSAKTFTSSDGITWTSHPQNFENYYGLAWSGSQFVRVGTYGKIQSSPDGITWTNHAVDSNYSFYSVAWSGTQFAAVGQSSSGMAGSFKIFTSPDGVTWTGHDAGTTTPLKSIIWTGSRFVAVGFVTVVTSLDGVTWTSIASYNGNTLNNTMWLGNQYLAVGNLGTILSSLDGSTWRPRSSGTTMDLRSIASSGSRTVIVGQNGTIITSTDLINWTPANSGTTNSLYSVIWTGNKFIAVGVATILSSPDGLTWTPSGSTQYTLRGVAWSGSQFVAVGYHALFTSPDGSTWTANTAQATKSFSSVTYFRNQFVAVGDKGIIQTSTDGTTWTPRSSYTDSDLNNVTALNSVLVAVGNGGTILTSYDGILWQAQQGGSTLHLMSDPWYALNGASSSGDGIIVVGQSGYILSSK
jgi:carboxypeptidase family protein